MLIPAFEESCSARTRVRPRTRGMRCGTVSMVPKAGHVVHTPPTDLGFEHWAEPVPPQPHCLVVEVISSLRQQILDVSQRQWIPHIQHHNDADHLGRRVEISERVVGFAHPQRLTAAPPSDHPFDRTLYCIAGLKPGNRAIHMPPGARSGMKVGIWRSGWDSNPRYRVTVYTLSRRAPSTTRPPLRIA